MARHQTPYGDFDVETETPAPYPRHPVQTFYRTDGEGDQPRPDYFRIASRCKTEGLCVVLLVDDRYPHNVIRRETWRPAKD